MPGVREQSHVWFGGRETENLVLDRVVLFQSLRRQTLEGDAHPSA